MPLASRWKDGYDWRMHERELNAVPMFTRTLVVDGFGELSVHYVRQQSRFFFCFLCSYIHLGYQCRGLCAVQQ